ncbi:hypothetical protein CUR178_01966 [Leishmania enriettii]|uniref:Uncharacterized protein n=1 Tax=Leishmania enriettii TaxID=5663 RepID=A0A836H2S7_LEIEN|nr:hypothetical protein CUR178_01966 [Leishmania enriettii]
MLSPYVSQQGGGDMFDFFFAVGASDAPCSSGATGSGNNADIGQGGGSTANGTNTVSAGPLIADSNGGGDGGGRLNFDFASLFFDGAQAGAYHDNALRAAGSGGGTGGADANGDVAESAGEDVVPTMSFFFPSDHIEPTVAGSSFLLPPASPSVDPATGAENRCAPLPLQAKSPEAVEDGAEESAGEEAAHIGARPGAALAVVKSAPHRASPVRETPLATLPCEEASSSAMNHERSLAAAMAAAPPSSVLLSIEESQLTAAQVFRSSDVEDTKLDETLTRAAADHCCLGAEALASSVARGVSKEEATPAPAQCQQTPPRAPPTSLPRSSHPPGAALVGGGAPPVPPSPRKPSAPLTPLTSAPKQLQAPLPTGMACRDATSAALRKAMAEAEEVWTDRLGMDGITGSEGRNSEAGVSSTGSTPSSSSDAVFFAEVAQLQQQTARLTEDSARSAASLQALTSDLLRILGPHAALSSLVGEQYARTPLVHLPWALIALLEELLSNDADAEEDGGDALARAKEADHRLAVPRPSSEAAEMGSSSVREV